MYFWNIKKLSKDLSKGLSEKEQFKYLLTMTILMGITMLAPNEGTFVDIISGIICFIFMLSVLFITYSINGGNKGKDFIIRNLTIGFVALIRGVVFAIPIILVVSILLGVIVGAIGGKEVVENLEIAGTIENNSFIIGIMTLWHAIYAYLLIKYFKDFRNKYELKEEK